MIVKKKNSNILGNSKCFNCSSNLWVIKVNKKREITSVRSALYYVIKFQLEKFLSTCHKFNYFAIPSMFPINKIQLNKVFHVKSPSRFSFFATCKLWNCSL